MSIDPPSWDPTTARLSDDQSNGPSVGCVLYIARAPNTDDAGRSLRLDTGDAVIGKGPGCDLRLSDPAVSSHHVRISVGADGLEISDLGSTNGTKLEGHVVTQATVVGAARLTLGETIVDIIPLGAFAEEQDRRTHYGDVCGSGEVMQRLYRQLARIEGSNAPVLVTGETGTGKELIARAIHSHSSRAARPYIIVDCASLPNELLASELFGHVQGAFTGSTRDHLGAFVEADGGSIFLDEIGELPADMQPKLLRVLETGQVRPLGANKHRRVDVRLIAATHRDLQAEVDGGRFRADLFYRLAVLTLRSPSLREHPEDIAALCGLLAERAGLSDKNIPPAARDFFQRYAWPGNVRELRNALIRVIALGEFESEAADDTTDEAPSTEGFRTARKKAIAVFEEAYLRDIWSRTSNVSAAAREAGIDRKHLRELLKKYDLYEP